MRLFKKPSHEEVLARWRANAEQSVLKNGALPSAPIGSQQVVWGQGGNSLGLDYGATVQFKTDRKGNKYIPNPHGSGDYRYSDWTGGWHAPGAEGGILMLSAPRTQDGEVEQMEGSDPYQTGSGTGPYNGAAKPNLYNDTNYSRYTDGHADLLENYKANWADKGMSKSEFGKMHWEAAGKSEGRTMPGIEMAAKSNSGGSGGTKTKAKDKKNKDKTTTSKKPETPKVSYARPNKKVIGHKTSQATILGSTYSDTAHWQPKPHTGEKKNSLVNSGKWMVKLDPNHALAKDPGQLKWKKPIVLSTY